MPIETRVRSEGFAGFRVQAFSRGHAGGYRPGVAGDGFVRSYSLAIKNSPDECIQFAKDRVREIVAYKRRAADKAAADADKWESLLAAEDSNQDQPATQSTKGADSAEGE